MVLNTEKHDYCAGELSFSAMDWGATLTRLAFPDKAGRAINLLLTPSDENEYLHGGACFNALVGRVTNRIKGASFSLDGAVYPLQANAGRVCLHGGKPFFSQMDYKARDIDEDGRVGVEFSRMSGDKEQGFPGNVALTARYTIARDNTFEIRLEAIADRPTPISLTVHAYYNLAGFGDILSHNLKIYSTDILECDEELCPTGRFLSVEGTPFDFRQTKAIGRDISLLGKSFGGYDHCYLTRADEGEVIKAAELSSDASGVKMELWTNQRALQLYTGNFLGNAFPRHAAVCLETQRLTNAVNIPTFPSIILRPGQKYLSITKLKFSHYVA